MASRDCIVLVPGFFGFGAFGEKPGSRIEYFDDVVDVLHRASGVPRDRIHVHEPPPTGALASRVRGLFETVLRVLGRESLRARRGPPPRVHLVGHSTGGVDARLLANHRYAWPKMDAGARREVARRLGTVTTLSAPLHGTPIAVRFRGPFRLLLDGLSVWSILDRRLDWRAVPGASLDALLHLLRIRHAAAEPIVGLLGRTDEETAAEIERFRGMLLGDHRLLEDLAPEAMQRLNRKVAGGDGPRLRHYATVAPEPELGADALERRLAYAACWRATASSRFEPRRMPEGAWVVGAPAKRLGDPPRANDGVVPVSSQVVSAGDRRRTRIVLGDHLDVIGHFDGKRSATIFKSSAGFGRREFEALWVDVARGVGGERS